MKIVWSGIWVLVLVVAAGAREYPARVVSVYDGDTLTMVVDLGLETVRTEKVRLLRIDAPELRGGSAESKAAAVRCRDWLRKRVLGKQVLLKTQKDRRGKYGRLLGEVWIDGQCVNDELLRKGLVVKWPKD